MTVRCPKERGLCSVSRCGVTANSLQWKLPGRAVCDVVFDGIRKVSEAEWMDVIGSFYTITPGLGGMRPGVMGV